MSSDVKIPGWAEKAAQDFHDKWETGMSGAAFRDLVRDLLAAERRGLEKSAALIEQGYERPVATPWSANGASKNDLCPHGMAVYQDCEQCAAAAIRSLGEKP